MNRGNRPLSPHLQVYRLPLPAILSITHRATGIILSIGSIALVYWLVAIAAGEAAYRDAQALLGSPLGLLLLFGWSWALFYHLCNGIRHLFWDAGYGFDLTTVYRSGWAVVIVSASLTLLSWALFWL